MSMALSFLPHERTEDGVAAIEELAAETDVPAVAQFIAYIRRYRMFTHSSHIISITN